MGAAFARDNCGYYSGEGKHGGPDPNPEINFNGKPRNRRTADNEDDLLEAATEWCAEEVQDGYCEYRKTIFLKISIFFFLKFRFFDLENNRDLSHRRSLHRSIRSQLGRMLSIKQ